MYECSQYMTVFNVLVFVQYHTQGDSKPHRKLPAIPVDKSPEALDKVRAH